VTPNPSPRSFRLGKELYDKKFDFDIQSGSTAEQIYQAALARKSYLHGEMYKISKELWPKYFGKSSLPSDSLFVIRKMIDTPSVKHVKAEEVSIRYRNTDTEAGCVCQTKGFIVYR
jgi:hypothetical protein